MHEFPQPPADGRFLAGIHVDEGLTRIAWRGTDGVDTEERPFHGFAWAAESPPGLGQLRTRNLSGDGALTLLLETDDAETARALASLRAGPDALEVLRPLECQVLLRDRLRFFAGARFDQVVRLQVDIETGCSEEGGFSDPERPGDRVLAIGLRLGDETHLLELEEDSDRAERELLKAFAEALVGMDPDIIEGHNLFNFDLHYLRRRGRRYRLPPRWGRFGAEAVFRPSRIRIAERWIDLSRCDIPGRTVFDTLLAAQFFDLTGRSLPSYGLKDLAIHFGITESGGNDRTYLDGDAIATTFQHDRERFRAYLADDLRETAGIADQLLPTYLAQAAIFPLTLQEIVLRGTGAKVESVFLDQYYHAGAALPSPGPTKPYVGGFSKSFESGVFHRVLHFDVVSLYPSLILRIGENPRGDTLGIFLPTLRRIREQRLRFKQMAKEAVDPALRREYDARQASFKILINSFYGYLGFGGARFGDVDLAARITEEGRELLQELIRRFQEAGCRVLEADTDGLYVEATDHWDDPAPLLRRVTDGLPAEIDLELGGRYRSMLCYKAKNYALHDGRSVIVRGSALRSRGMEPFLKELTDILIARRLGLDTPDPREAAGVARERIEAGEMPVTRLARREFLSQSPGAYRKAVEGGGKKPRRAALEVALTMDPPPRMGDRVSYFIAPGERKSDPEWKKARELGTFDPVTNPYDPGYYLKRLRQWEERYADLLG